MEKLSGLVLDLYDDSRGEILRSYFPDPLRVPETIKQAHYLSSDERLALPDDVFALVLHDGDVTLRKFACVDPGNTLMSLLYLTKTASKLPMEAVQVALENLKVASNWYWNDSDELEKAAGIGGALASGVGGLAKSVGSWAMKNPTKALTRGLAVASGVGAAKQVGSNLRNVSAREQMAGGFGTIV